jgi:SAM-dependent methyltransferase
MRCPSLIPARSEGHPATKTSLLQRLAADGYEWLFDRVDPLGGGDHRRRLVQQAAGEVVDGTAEALPFPEAAFDTVVASLVLCTVPDLAQTLAEARRVLRPGGTLRFYQHVRADDPRLTRWQDRLERPWGWLAGGCHPTATSPPPGSACWSWTGSTSRSCPRWSAPTSSGCAATHPSRLRPAGRGDASATKERPRNRSDLGARCGG